jgi:HopA1 effector protein family
MNILKEIFDKIKVYPNYVSHVDYPSDPPTAEFIQCFDQLSIELQHHYLKLELQDLLYRVYFSREVATEEDSKLLVNDRVQGIDLQFVEQLKQSNAGTGYYDRGWQILREKADGLLAVHKAGLTLHIYRDRLENSDTSIGDTASIRLPNSRIEDHYYVAVSNFGEVKDSTIDFFFNLKSEAASKLIAHITQQLECAFTLKVALDPEDYQRCDACILRISSSNYPNVWAIVRAFYRSYSELFLEAIPFLTEQLAPGLALAEFGLDHCEIIAEALLL